MQSPGELKHWYEEMEKDKPRKRYMQFVEEEEAKYKARQEEKLLEEE